MLKQYEFHCHCLMQTGWYRAPSNFVLDAGELLSIGLPDSSQKITVIIVGVMMAIKWLEAYVGGNKSQEAPTKEELEELNCLKVSDLFDAMCKTLKIPMEVKSIWARRRLFPWFRANMTAWLYYYAKLHMSKHSRVYSSLQLDIGPEASKQVFVTHGNAVTTFVKRTARTVGCDEKGREQSLKEDLERNVTLYLHNSFCSMKETAVDRLPCCKQGWKSKGVED